MNTVKGTGVPLLLALLSALGILFFSGENPAIFLEAIYNTFFSPFGLGYTIYYSTPLIFTGLSVALCFHAGLFNIGAEGQLLWGSIAIVWVSHYFSTLPSYLAIPLGIFISVLAGSLWALIPAYLKSYRGCHEVVTTLLLNFIASSWIGYLILYPLKNSNTQSAETEWISSSYWIPRFSEGSALLGINLFRTTPANFTFFIAVLIAFLVYFFLYRTIYGFEWRSMGKNATASRFAGIQTQKQTILLFMLSGGLAGLVGVNEVMGSEHKVIEGFSPGYGFTGIAVALLANNHPLGIILSALLFGSLQNISRELEFLGENISKDISVVIQALLISLIAGRFWRSQRSGHRGISHG